VHSTLFTFILAKAFHCCKIVSHKQPGSLIFTYTLAIDKVIGGSGFWGGGRCRTLSYSNLFLTYFLCRANHRPSVPTLHRHCTENSKHIFPEMKLRGLVPSSYIHVSVSYLYTHTIGLPILLQENWITNRGNNKSLTDTSMRKSGMRPRSFFLVNT
jgi:hypothetical protein